ncbi:MAG: dephospho-CoA kinase [bacterium]|nr:dephospho-CoA kinase [bacterium]
MYKIGLTGGICTGKTFILNIFKELNCYTVKGDDIAKNIIFSNQPEIVDKIVEVFGETVRDPKTGIDKDEFSRLLFQDPEKRGFISRFIHPKVAEERKNILNDLKDSNVYDFFIYESALLVESGIYKEFEKIIVVYTSQEEQIKRLMERDGINKENADARIKSQFPLSEKLKVANYTIDTTGSFEIAKTKTLETFHLMKKDFNFK